MVTVPWYAGQCRRDTKQNAVTTNGTVTDAEPESYDYQADDDVEEETAYRPAVTYQYTVDGKQYNSTAFYDEIDHTPTYGVKSDARAVMPPGPTTVYYLPDSPDRSFLVKPSVNWLATAFGGLTVGFIAVGCTYVLLHLVWSLASDLLADST